MPAGLSFKDFFEALGRAIIAKMFELHDAKARFPLRRNSQVKRTARAVVTQGRAASGRFEGFTANTGVTILAEDYLQWMDSGRRPRARRVPILALVKFIKDRGLKYRDRTTGRFKRERVRLRGRNGGPDVSVTKLAFLIQSAIFRNGIRGKHFIAPALAYGSELLEIYLDRDALDVMTRDFEAQLKFL